MHDGMQYDPIQGQGREPLKVGINNVKRRHIITILNVLKFIYTCTERTAKARPTDQETCNQAITDPTYEILQNDHGISTVEAQYSRLDPIARESQPTLARHLSSTSDVSNPRRNYVNVNT